MRRLLALAGSIMLAAVASGCSEGDDSSGQTPRPAPQGVERLSTRDGAIVDEDGDRVLLRGMNAFGEIETGSGITRAELDRMADAGFNVVRLVVHWDTLEPEAPVDGRHNYRQDALEAIDASIDRARDAGLYVVLSPVHLFKLSPAFGGRGIPAWVYQQRGYDLARAEREVATDSFMHENLYALLRLLAKRYADDPVVAAIDPVNEPPTAPQDAILDWYREIAGVVRSAAPETMILVEPRFGDHNMSTVDLRRLGDRTNLVLSPHFYYAGGAGDGYGPDGSKNGKYLFDGKATYHRGSEKDLEAHLERSTKAAKAAGMPVWIGEFGVGVETEGAREYLEDMTAVMARQGVGWAFWVHRSNDSFSATGNDGAYRPVVEPLSEAARDTGG